MRPPRSILSSLLIRGDGVRRLIPGTWAFLGASTDRPCIKTPCQHSPSSSGSRSYHNVPPVGETSAAEQGSQGPIPLTKLLIANRGEIACRVITSARKLGIPTAAVFSEADRSAVHARTADEAFCIGPAAARDSYLRMDRILEVLVSSSTCSGGHLTMSVMNPRPLLSRHAQYGCMKPKEIQLHSTEHLMPCKSAC